MGRSKKKLVLLTSKVKPSVEKDSVEWQKKIEEGKEARRRFAITEQQKKEKLKRKAIEEQTKEAIRKRKKEKRDRIEKRAAEDQELRFKKMNRPGYMNAK